MSKITFKQTSVPGSIPNKSQLDVGDIAINTYDGKIYMKRSSTDSVIEIGDTISNLGFTPLNSKNGTLNGSLTLVSDDKESSLVIKPINSSQDLVSNAFEWDNDNLYYTNKNKSRQQIAFTNSDISGASFKWATKRCVSLVGDATVNFSIDGSADVQGSIHLNSVNSNVGKFGAFNKIPVLSVNEKGLITSIGHTDLILEVSGVNGAAPLLNPTFYSSNELRPSVVISTESNTHLVPALVVEASNSDYGMATIAFNVAGIQKAYIAAKNNGVLGFNCESQVFDFGSQPLSKTEFRQAGELFASITGSEVNFHSTPTVNGNKLLTMDSLMSCSELYVDESTQKLSLKNIVTSVAGKNGEVSLEVCDVLGAAPTNSPVFTGEPVSPTPDFNDSSKKIATTEFVKKSIAVGQPMIRALDVQTTQMATSIVEVRDMTPTTIASFNAVKYQTSKFFVQINDEFTRVQAYEILCTHNDQEILYHIANVVCIGEESGAFECGKREDMIELIFKPNSSSTKKITTFRTSLAR